MPSPCLALRATACPRLALFTTRPAPAEPPPRERPKKKISLCFDTNAEANQPAEEKTSEPASEPAVESADLDTPEPASWLDSQMALFRDHDQIEGEEDTRLLRRFLAIVSEESDRLELAVSDDEARAAALALRKDLALGLVPMPEAGRNLVPMTIELLHRVGLGH